MTVGSWYTATYVLGKQLKNTMQLRNGLLAYLLILDLFNAPKPVIQRSLQSAAVDLEDAYQYFTALHHEADYFLTGNLKDFRTIAAPDLPVITPADFMKIWLLAN